MPLCRRKLGTSGQREHRKRNIGSTAMRMVHAPSAKALTGKLVLGVVSLHLLIIRRDDGRILLPRVLYGLQHSHNMSDA